MVLSAEELASLTGVGDPHRQAEVLEHHRIPFSRRSDGTIQLQHSDLERHHQTIEAWGRHVAQHLVRSDGGRGKAAIRAMFMAPEEIAALCGLSQPTAQARWLELRGYKFERRADGTIALQRAEVNYHTLTGAMNERPTPRAKPDWDALLDLSARGGKWSGDRK